MWLNHPFINLIWHKAYAHTFIHTQLHTHIYQSWILFIIMSISMTDRKVKRDEQLTLVPWSVTKCFWGLWISYFRAFINKRPNSERRNGDLLYWWITKPTWADRMGEEPFKDSNVCGLHWSILRPAAIPLPQGLERTERTPAFPGYCPLIQPSGGWVNPAGGLGEYMHQNECGFVSQGVSQTDGSLCWLTAGWELQHFH